MGGPIDHRPRCCGGDGELHARHSRLGFTRDRLRVHHVGRQRRLGPWPWPRLPAPPCWRRTARFALSPNGSFTQKALQFQQLPDATGRGQLVTFTFSAPVSNVAFTFYDIDNMTGIGWGDRIQMVTTGYTSASPAGAPSSATELRATSSATACSTTTSTTAKRGKPDASPMRVRSLRSHSATAMRSTSAAPINASACPT